VSRRDRLRARLWPASLVTGSGSRLTEAARDRLRAGVHVGRRGTRAV
jgi:hypothetical protein